MLIKILIAGDGGQGVQTIAQILSQAAFQSNYQVSLIPNYGLEQRGGMSLAYLQISDQQIAYPRFSRPDYLFLMSKQVRPRVEQYLPKSQHIVETEKYLDLLKEKNLPVLSYNLLVLGMITKILSEQSIISSESVKAEIESKLKNKPGFEDNLKVFEIGVDIKY